MTKQGLFRHKIYLFKSTFKSAVVCRLQFKHMWMNLLVLLACPDFLVLKDKMTFHFHFTTLTSNSAVKWGRLNEVCWRKGCCLKIHGVYVKVWSCQKATRPEWVAGGQVALSVRDTSFSPPYLLLFSAKVKTLTSVLCQGSRESIYLGWDAASTTSWHPLSQVKTVTCRNSRGHLKWPSILVQSK